MEKFNLILDEKVSIWRRTDCVVYAESIEDAIDKIINGDYDTDDSEFLYVTEELLSEEPDAPSVEIFSSTYDLIWDNDSRSIRPGSIV